LQLWKNILSIKIPSNDGRICDQEQVIIDIIHAIHTKNAKIRLTTNGEGPCIASLGLYRLLDNICKRFEYPKNQIYIETKNQLEQHSEYNITINTPMSYLEETRSRTKHHDCIKKFNNNFKHFGHFVGHSNLPRLQLASFLHVVYPKQTLQSYHCRVTDPYHRSHIGLEDLLYNNCNAEEFNWAKLLIEASPISIDAIESFPILMPETLGIVKVYPSFFVELVSLSYFSGNTFYIDEKIWRPIMMKTPFMVQGPANFLHNFKKLGFQTFDRWWDEGYSEDPADFQITGIKDNIRRLSELTIDELAVMYQEMLPVLEHNWNRMQEITHDDFLTAFAR
jgi:hypothetical protein